MKWQDNIPQTVNCIWYLSLVLRHHKVAESCLMQSSAQHPGVGRGVNICPLFLGLKGMFNQIPAEEKLCLFDIKLCLILEKGYLGHMLAKQTFYLTQSQSLLILGQQWSAEVPCSEEVWGSWWQSWRPGRPDSKTWRPGDDDESQQEDVRQRGGHGQRGRGRGQEVQGGVT